MCRLCAAITVDYKKETIAKTEAFQSFWNRHDLGGTVRPLVPSPFPRRYRTVSKRRTFERGETLLGLTDFTGTRGMQPLNVTDCPIEPEVHNEIYRTAQGVLFRSRVLSRVLNYLVIKGTYDDLTIILSVNRSDSRVRGEVASLSKDLTRKFKSIRSVFTVEDEASSFYLSDKAEKLNRVFGKKDISYEIGGIVYHFSPLSFSQTNLSVLPTLVAEVRRLIAPVSADRLWDLYCGWGILGLSMADKVTSLAGMEVAGPSVDAARSTARRNRLSNARFVRQSVTPTSLNGFLNRVGPPTKIILDPPRSGVQPGVIDYLAVKKPSRIVHVFCNVEEMPRELAEWKRCGYSPVETVPIDMFPATEHLEVIVALEQMGKGKP